MCQSCFTAFHAKARLAAFRLILAGTIPAKTSLHATSFGRTGYLCLNVSALIYELCEETQHYSSRLVAKALEYQRKVNNTWLSDQFKVL